MILISLCYLLSIKRSYDPIQFQATSVLFTILPSIPYLVGLHFNQRQTKNMQQHEKISDYLEEWLWINWQFQLVSIKSKNTYCNTHHNLVCSAVADLNSTGWTVIRGTFHIIFIFVFSLSILYIVSNIVDLNSSADYHYSLIIIIQHKILKLKTTIETTWVVHPMKGPLGLHNSATPQQTWLSSVLLYVFFALDAYKFELSIYS